MVKPITRRDHIVGLQLKRFVMLASEEIATRRASRTVSLDGSPVSGQIDESKVVDWRRTPVRQKSGKIKKKHVPRRETLTDCAKAVKKAAEAKMAANLKARRWGSIPTRVPI